MGQKSFILRVRMAGCICAYWRKHQESNCGYQVGCMKKLLIAVTALVLILSISACSIVVLHRIQDKVPTYPTDIPPEIMPGNEFTRKYCSYPMYSYQSRCAY